MPLDDGLTFANWIQPPTIPPDPIGDDWRGLQGPPGPPGLDGAPGPPGSGGSAYDLTVSGAEGDGVTDDTALIQTFLNNLPVGSEVVLRESKQFLIDSANLTIPVGLTIQGQGGLEGGSRIGGPAFILNPLYRIIVQSGDRLSNFKILRKGLLESPTTGQANTAVDAWMAEAILRKTSVLTASGTTLPFSDTSGITVDMAASGDNIATGATVTAINPGVSVTFSGTRNVPVAAGSYVRFGNSVALDCRAGTGFGGINLDRLFILGFHTGILTQCGRVYTDMLEIDSIIAMFVVNGGDASYINRIHCVPYYGGDWTRRSGPGFLITRADGWHLTSCTTVGWANGFVLCGSGGVTLSRCWMETSDDGVTSTCGFRTEGHVINECSMINCIGGGSVQFDFQHTGGFLNVVSPITAVGAVSATTICHYRLGPGSSGQIMFPEMVTGLVTPFVVQSGVGRWRIISPQMNTAPNPWISGAAGDLAKISIQSAWSNDLTVDQQVQTHLLEKVWISRNTALASIDGSPAAALAVESLAASTGNTELQSFHRNGTRLGYIGTANNNTALQLTGDGTRDLSFLGNTKIEMLSPTTHVGASFGSTIASSVTDMASHVALYGNTFGFSVTNSRLNLISGNAIYYVSAGVDQIGFAPGVITFLNPTSNVINFGANGIGAPTFTTRSAGAKLVLYPAISGASADIGIGLGPSALWMGVRDAADVFRWYAGTTNVATLSGAGALSLNGGITAPGLTQATGVLTLLNGTANIIDFSGIGVAAPTFTTRSVGTKIVFYPAIGGASADIAMGMASNTLWMGVRTASDQFAWYAGTTSVATLSGAGLLALAGGLTVPGTVSGAGVTALLAPYAPLASPALTGVPTVPTAAPGTNTTQAASTAFVIAEVAGGVAGVSSFNTRTGAVTLTSGDVTGALTFTPYNATNPTGYQTSAQVIAAIAAANPGAFSTLSASGAVSGAGITALFASPPALGGTAPAAAAHTTISATGQITSTLATGTAPLVVASTTVVANLNASALGGATFAAPGSIGSGTAAAGAFTTLSASSTVSGSGFSTYLASPPAIGGTAAAAGSFTTLSASSTVSGSGFTSLLAPYAPLASPTFTGTVTIPSGASISGFAPLASPTFTGTPALPTGTTGVTQSAGTKNTSLATTAFSNAVRNHAMLQAQWVNGAIVTNDTVWMSYDAPYAGTINTLKHESATGTFTVAIKINGTNVTSLSAVSVTSTPGTATATGANTFSAGDKITAVISAAASSPTDAILSLDLTWA